MRAMLAALVLIAFAPAKAAPQTVIALPVGQGVPGGGPWKIQVWPYEGCKDCSIDERDANAVQRFLRDVLGEGDTAASFANTRFTTVRLAKSQGEVPSSMTKIRQELRGCKIGSAGKLMPNPTSNAVAFGVRFDCPNSQHPGWMSVVMGKDHVPRAVYWLPDKPIYASAKR